MAVEDLKSTAATDEDRRRMQEILRRVHDNDDGGAALAEALGMQPPPSACPACPTGAGSALHVRLFYVRSLALITNQQQGVRMFTESAGACRFSQLPSLHCMPDNQ